MGLLDEAIREHLELKRLRGADPHEVSLQEREVLGAAPGDEGPPAGGSYRAERAGAGVHRAAEPSHAAPTPAFDWAESWSEPPPRPDHALSEETAELDMQAVMAGESSALT